MKMLKILCRSAIWKNKTAPTVAPAAAATALDTIVSSLTCQASSNCSSLYGLHGYSPGKNLLPIIPTLTTTLNRNLTTFTNIKEFIGGNCERLRRKGLDQNSKTPQTITSSKRNMASGGSSVKDNSSGNAKAAAEENTDKKLEFTNRLISERSPYLLQHAHNPVDWYPWGDEAIEKAREENKLIFLSIGYSTCHWCHVMERESFENKAVAEIMNQNFINIKVDREERPDIDRIYMHFVLMMTGNGGWPMSVWLTPDLAPISAGTYFPPYDRWGTPSFATVLRTIASKWTANEDHLKSTGMEVIETIKRSLSEKPALAAFRPSTCDGKLSETLLMLEKRFDSEFGGFTSHPKFPEVSRLNFLFHAYIATKEDTVLNMALQTLKCIGQGGIHDHIFGGFSRYSVDGRWHVPHFEKMLYDQGQLMMAYATAYKLTGESIYLDYADGIYRYITTDLQHPKGGFYAGEDADSLPKANDKQKVEGAFYAWTYDSIKAAFDVNAERYQGLQLPTACDAFEIYAFHYNLQPTGNVHPSSDPHGHLTGKNILIITDDEQKTCEQFDISKEKLKRLLNITNDILHNLRNKRPRPHLDTKIICSWNGLVLSGLSALANCNSPKRSEYLIACKKLIEFIHVHLYEEERRLKRSCYGVDVTDENALIVGQIDGFLDDYAFLIKGLLDYYTASLDQKVLQWAKTLQDLQLNQFWDNNQGAFYYSKENAHNVVVRLKDDHDGAEPCGNSVSARNLILLSHYFNDTRYKQRASEIFQYFADQKSFGYTLPEMMSALLLYANGLDLVAVVGPDNEYTKRMMQICRSYYIPGIIILYIDPQAMQDGDIDQQRNAEKFKMVNDQPTVYICTDKICRMPVTDVEQLERTLKQSFFRRKVLNRNQASE